MAKETPNTPQNPASPEELLAMQTAQGEVIAAQNEEIEALRRQVQEMQSEGSAGGKKPALGSVIAKVGKTQYRVVHGLIVGGKNLTPAEIAQDTELCKQLAADKSTALEQL